MQLDEVGHQSLVCEKGILFLFVFSPRQVGWLVVIDMAVKEGLIWANISIYTIWTYNYLIWMFVSVAETVWLTESNWLASSLTGLVSFAGYQNINVYSG